MTTSAITLETLESTSDIKSNQSIPSTEINFYSSLVSHVNSPLDPAGVNWNYRILYPKSEGRDDSFIRLNEKRKAILSPDIPTLEGLDIHNPALTDRVRVLLQYFWAIVMSQALQSTFPVNKAFVEVFSDPSENRKKVSIKVFAEATASQSVAFWEGLEDDIQEWVKTLDNHSKLLFLRDISLRIHWK